MRYAGLALLLLTGCCSIVSVNGFVAAGGTGWPRKLLGHNSFNPGRSRGRVREGSFSLRCDAQEQSVYVFDFDGVLCNTVSNYVETAVLAARQLWPETMQECAYLSARDAGVRKSWVGYDWSQYEADEGGHVPRWLEEKLKQLRPVASDPADLVLAARLCVSEAVTAKRSPSGERPLSAGEMVENWDFMRDVLLHKYQCKKNDLLSTFTAQEAAGQDDIVHWMEKNPLYPGIDIALRSFGDKIYVLTSNEQDFTNSVLKRSGVELERSRVVKVSQDTKVQALSEIAKEYPGTALQVFLTFTLIFANTEHRLHYFDDNAGVIKNVVSDLFLSSRVNVYFASWGYSTPGQKASVAAWPRVQRVELNELNELMH
ncbi:hypothetical protein GUITHDRAFT_131635 [Guillardia theta CCMP2712]|uniref:Haloacid dehalogenase-like hydrolase n=1 Tax=Guillardia theta (strain CCMP2712) TaxID=905079 RepID=L1K4B0_GUITC|nr:hypothetical protein GUITHDRAFT_131635 [Guillardia theta CCMP2712]EKX55439.1 hypothetical protein GUITHDRAFT_131635 [Guillardia theta CCMP2712]|eukprot:XP_005842419.1 hypothetical protein GUITHDRAFT_131635 [Guillardia theta CCMP2712]